MKKELYLAKSMAGHDKNHLYLVTDEVDGLFYLCNGTTKKLSNPKKKKKMHLQVIKNLKPCVCKVIDETDTLDDEAIINILDAYKQELESRQIKE